VDKNALTKMFTSVSFLKGWTHTTDTHRTCPILCHFIGHWHCQRYWTNSL